MASKNNKQRQRIAKIFYREFKHYGYHGKNAKSYAWLNAGIFMHDYEYNNGIKIPDRVPMHEVLESCEEEVSCWD